MKQLEKLTKYKIKDQKLFQQAFTHKSFVKSRINNERLEFLGDALLNIFVAELLFKNYPAAEEGELSKKRSQWVSGSCLAKIACDLKLFNYIKAENKNLKKNPRILAGALEAYLGAVYLDSGITAVRKIVKKLFGEKIKQNSIDTNYKSILQEWCQKKHREVPIYKIKEERGVEHNKVFYTEVFIKNKAIAEGFSRQKKQAEQEAAQKALKKLKLL